MDRFICDRSSVLDHNRGDDRLGIGRNRAVSICRFGVLGDLLRDLQPLGHIAEGCVLAVQKSGIGHRDEKLGACRIRILGPCHGDHASFMLQVIFEAVAPSLFVSVNEKKGEAAHGRLYG